MRLFKITVVACSLALLGGSLGAADRGMAYDSKFRDREVQLDIFGTASVGEDTLENFSGERIERNTRAGLGLGLNVFFLRYVGIGGEAYTENTANSFIDSASGSVILRYPIDSISLAPYMFGGGGYKFDLIEEAFGHGGGGLEFRLHPNAGLFIDARYVLPEITENFGLGRIGLRLVY